MKENGEEKSSFWIAYADLMAGLLFVFLLLIAAVVVKYVLSQKDLQELKDSLNKQEQSLEQSKNELRQKEAIVFKLSDDLNKKDEALSLSKSWQAQLEANITSFSNLSKELESNLDEKDKQILILLSQLERKENELKSLQDSFLIAKEKVKELGFLKENLSKEIQARLDSNLSIDEKSGAIILPSEVLFDKDSFILKDEAKANLKQILSSYFRLILDDENIASQIENIIIEGHTDSDGSYIYNLDLSQKRAYEVMSFIYSFYKDTRLQKLLMASGRSYATPIFRGDKEDKDASRRIEIKFNIKNDNALKKVEKFFELQ